MPEQHEAAENSGPAPEADRLRQMPGLPDLLAEAEAVWQGRAAAAGEAVDLARPGWRTFEDAFPTFYEFTNRPR
jgi:hypothetical protein